MFGKTNTQESTAIQDATIAHLKKLLGDADADLIRRGHNPKDLDIKDVLKTAMGTITQLTQVLTNPEKVANLPVDYKFQALLLVASVLIRAAETVERERVNS